MAANLTQIWRYGSCILDWGFFLCAGFLLLHDVVWLATYLANKLAKVVMRAEKTAKNTNAINTARRAFMTNSANAGIITLSVGFTAYGGYRALRVPEIKQIAVGIDNLPTAFEGIQLFS